MSRNDIGFISAVAIAFVTALFGWAIILFSFSVELPEDFGQVGSRIGNPALIKLMPAQRMENFMDQCVQLLFVLQLT